ncbi:hypothetical protein ACIP5N_33915 [Streptomyces sp. NPDC088768]|uniref:hypothetical protein n=1 Tax=Streptomyces sp. NPDC088768 TaxID=3365894 RepID=UPI0037F3F20A
MLTEEAARSLRDALADQTPMRAHNLLTAVAEALLSLEREREAEPTRQQQLLALIRSEGGEWTRERARAAYRVLGLTHPNGAELRLSDASADLQDLADAGLIKQYGKTRFGSA